MIEPTIHEQVTTLLQQYEDQENIRRIQSDRFQNAHKTILDTCSAQEAIAHDAHTKITDASTRMVGLKRQIDEKMKIVRRGTITTSG